MTGINGESSFKRDLLQHAPGCEAWGYDYSVNDVRVPTSPSFFYRAPLTTRTALNQWGPEISDDRGLHQRAQFKPWALGGTDNHRENDDPKWWTLDSLMKLNGAGLLFFSFRLPNPPAQNPFFFVTKEKKG